MLVNEIITVDILGKPAKNYSNIKVGVVYRFDCVDKSMLINDIASFREVENRELKNNGISQFI